MNAQPQVDIHIKSFSKLTLHGQTGKLSQQKHAHSGEMNIIKKYFNKLKTFADMF